MLIKMVVDVEPLVCTECGGTTKNFAVVNLAEICCDDHSPPLASNFFQVEREFTKEVTIDSDNFDMIALIFQGCCGVMQTIPVKTSR
jgi:hypothetical protein